ncbi:MAG: hypothetical protein ACYCTE_11770 [Acidimicrobiales bacterium]
MGAIDGTVYQLAQEVAAMRGEMKSVNTSLRTIVDCGFDTIHQRFISRFGAIEDHAADKLSSALELLGYKETSTARHLMFDRGSVGVVTRARHADGRTVHGLCQAEWELAESSVRQFGEQMHDPHFLEQLAGAGLGGPYIACAYGERVEIHCDVAARSFGLGLLKYSRDVPLVEPVIMQGLG